jgi:hypothetical protein
MKKILLLFLASCFFIVQTKIVFGKCHAYLTIKRASDSATWDWFNGTNPSNTSISISPGDHLVCTYSCDGVCPNYSPSWYRLDSTGNYNLIQSSSGNISAINLSLEGLYMVQPQPYGCLCYSYYFQIIIMPAGINDLTSSALLFPFSGIASNINLNNLRYTIINPMGQIVEHGNFSGEIILRNQKPQRPLPAGIYFVIYSDALDNRQVLTDKVFVDFK